MIQQTKKQQILKELHEIFKKYDLTMESSSYQLSTNVQTFDIYSSDDVIYEESDEGCAVINKESFNDK